MYALTLPIEKGLLLNEIWCCLSTFFIKSSPDEAECVSNLFVLNHPKYGSWNLIRCLLIEAVKRTFFIVENLLPII
jgi:hypothetical protein